MHLFIRNNINYLYFIIMDVSLLLWLRQYNNYYYYNRTVLFTRVAAITMTDPTRCPSSGMNRHRSTSGGSEAPQSPLLSRNYQRFYYLLSLCGEVDATQGGRGGDGLISGLFSVSTALTRSAFVTNAICCVLF